MRHRRLWKVWVTSLLLALGSEPLLAQAQTRYFEILVVSEDGGSPVPCVELRSVHGVVWQSDDNGRVAFYEPGLMGTDVWLHISGEHVDVSEDGFGYRGATVFPEAGAAAEIRVRWDGSRPCAATDVESRRIARGLPGAGGYVQVNVVDAETERGVPLAQLELGGRVLQSDSAGHFALDPFDVEDNAEVRLESPGFMPATLLLPRAGGMATARLERNVPAERLVRLTGGGIYRDTTLLGLEAPLNRPNLNGLVLGQDTVFATPYRGRIFWLWGDTNRPAYPLGNFRTACAFSPLPSMALPPERGVNFDYIVGEDGFAKQMAPPETIEGEGLAWLQSLVAVPDAAGEERLFAVFSILRSLSDRYRFGMARFDDATERFEEVVLFEGRDSELPRENAFRVVHGDATWIYYHRSVRVPARAEALVDPSLYESFTPFTDASRATLERDDEGRAVYRWRRGVGQPEFGDVGPQDSIRDHIVDVRTGRPFPAHVNGSTQFNDYLGRYVRLISPRFSLGETWVAFADTPMGPWVHAGLVSDHPQTSFYNPRHHRFYDEDHGRRIYYEGTYTNSFSGNPVQVPRYEYNQLLYALDLDGPALALPVPIYESERQELGPHDVVREGDAPLRAEFFAPVRPGEGTVPVWWSGPSCEERVLNVGGAPQTPPLFYALPPEAEPGPHHVALVGTEDGRYITSRESGGDAVAWVWRNPVGVAFPVGEYLPERVDAGPDRCLVAGDALDLEGAEWFLDGEVVSDSVAPAVGLYTLTRRETRADGLVLEDSAIVRVGLAPEPPDPPDPPDPPEQPEPPGPETSDGGCACRAVHSSTQPRFLFLFLALVGLRRLYS